MVHFWSTRLVHLKATELTENLSEWLSGRPSAPGEALGARLAQGLREAVLQGVIAPGQRLPATRALAERLGVARNTLVAVYVQLAAEGFVVAGQGSGTYACRVAPDRVGSGGTRPPAKAASGPVTSLESA